MEVRRLILGLELLEDHTPLLEDHTPLLEDHSPLLEDHTPLLETVETKPWIRVY